MFSKKFGPDYLSIQNNIFSQRYLIKRVEGISAKIQTTLKDILKSSKDNNYNQEVLDLLENINDLTDLHLESIKSEKDGESNQNLLVNYLNQIIKMLNSTQKSRVLDSKDNTTKISSLLPNIEVDCQGFKNYLKDAVDINIYMIDLPSDEYKTIKENSETFHFKKTSIVPSNTKKFINTFKFFGACFGGIVYPWGLVSQQKEEDYTSYVDTLAAQSLFKSDQDKVLNYGYTYRNNLRVNSLTKDNRINWRDIKPVEAKTFDKDKRLFILVCNSHENFSRYGTNFLFEEKLNRKGCVLIFDSIVNAIRYAKLSSNGLNYDRIGGWRVDNVWEDSEREKLRECYLFYHTGLKNICSFLPTEVTQVVIDYLQGDPIQINVSSGQPSP